MHTVCIREIRIKRIYDAPARGDGYRVLVDRVWPRDNHALVLAEFLRGDLRAGKESL